MDGYKFYSVAIVNRSLDMTDLSPVSQVSKKLNRARVKRNRKDLEALKKVICDTVNSFRPQVNQTVL